MFADAVRCILSNVPGSYVGCADGGIELGVELAARRYGYLRGFRFYVGVAYQADIRTM